METLQNTIKNSYRHFKYHTSKVLNEYLFPHESYLLILGGITGILCGFGAVIFHLSIEWIYEIFFLESAHFFHLESFLHGKSYFHVVILVLIPAIGGLIVGTLAYFFENGKKGEGIPNVIDSVASKGGRIKGSVAILKTIQSAVSIGTGGAGGKEGPIVQIGAAIGSAFGQFLQITPDKLKILVGCGAAAGLSAAFNAPLGGALFSMEIIIRNFNTRYFSPIIVASVFGTVISRIFLGNEPAFQIPKYALESNNEFIFYIILGVLAGLTAVYFVKIFLKIDDYFEGVKVPAYIRPAIGGLLVGLIGIVLPGVYGFSYKFIDSSLYNHASFYILLSLLIFKPIATGFTIGSGGSGGTFAPSLFTGAMLGGAFGQAINFLFPEYQVFPGAYALVGMAAVVAGTTHASLTALIMVFELTNNYKIILPLMLTIIIASIVSRSILKGSLYTLKFDKEGKQIDIYGRKVSILKNIPVHTLLESYTDFVSPRDSYDTILKALQQSRFNTLLVRDDAKNIIGQITFQHIRTALLDEESKSILPYLVANDLLLSKVPQIETSSNAEEALSILEYNEIDFLPIFDKEQKTFVGVVTKDKILRIYQNELFLKENESDLSLH